MLPLVCICVYVCVYLRICLHLSLSIRSRFSWIISETEKVSHIFYFQSPCDTELRHLSIDKEKSEPIAYGWHTFQTFCQALINVTDVMVGNLLL